MSANSPRPDLELLCSQVFDGVERFSGKDIISSRRKLLYQEAAKALHQAGFEGDAFSSEMSALEALIERHLSRGTDNTQARPEKEKIRTADDARGPSEGQRQSAVLNFKDGSRYEGALLNNAFDGEGTMKWPDGATYSGSWKDGKSHGQGKHQFADGGIYEGEFVNDAFDGEGTMTWAEGTTYSGAWREGKHHGRGKHRGSNGDIYEGEWKNGAIEGEGALAASDGSEFLGAWKGGKFTGRAKNTQYDGAAYEGDIVAGKREGKGRLVQTDGAEYVGEWKDDQQHGQGVFTMPNGKVQSGRFVSGAYMEPWRPALWRKSKKAAALVALLLVSAIAGPLLVFLWSETEPSDYLQFAQRQIKAITNLGGIDAEDAQQQFAELPETAFQVSSAKPLSPEARRQFFVAETLEVLGSQALSTIKNSCGPNDGGTILKTRTAAVDGGVGMEVGYCCAGDKLCEPPPPMKPELDQDGYAVLSDGTRLSGPYDATNREILADRYVLSHSCVYEAYSGTIVARFGSCDDGQPLRIEVFTGNDRDVSIQVTNRVWAATGMCCAGNWTEEGYWSEITTIYEIK